MELVTGAIRPRRLDEVRNAQGLVGLRRNIASSAKAHRRHYQFVNPGRNLGRLREVASASTNLGEHLVMLQSRRSSLSRRKITAQQSARIAASVELQPLNGSV